MNEKRESFVFHRDWYSVIRKRSDKIRLEVYDAIVDMVFDGKHQKLSELSSVVMDFVAPQIERDYAKRLDIKEKRKESGSKGGRPPKVKESKENQKNQMVSEKPNGFQENQIKPNESNSVSVSDNVSVENNLVLFEEKVDTIVSPKKENKKFIKPTVAEIREYVILKGYRVDAEAFFNFYESKGWVVGKSPMKNWRAAVATWERSRKANLFNNEKDRQQAAREQRANEVAGLMAELATRNRRTDS